MKRARIVPGVMTALVLAFAVAAFAQGDKASADSWKKNATDTRAIVQQAVEQAVGQGAESHAVAGEVIRDAQQWLELGDTAMVEGDQAMSSEDYGKAAQAFNQAWQYYVKAGTAAVRSNMLITSGQ